jgi:hypothetical protein
VAKSVGITGAAGVAGAAGVSESVGTVGAVAAAETVGFAVGRDDTAGAAGGNETGATDSFSAGFWVDGVGFSMDAAGFSEAGGNAPVFARRVAIARKSSSSAVAVRAPG